MYLSDKNKAYRKNIQQARIMKETANLQDHKLHRKKIMKNEKKEKLINKKDLHTKVQKHNDSEIMILTINHFPRNG